MLHRQAATCYTFIMDIPANKISSYKKIDKIWYVYLFGILILLFILYAYGKHVVSQSLTPQPTPTPLAASSGNISVNTPVVDDRVGEDFQVTGKARTFQNVVSIRVSNKITGSIYYLGRAPVNAANVGQFGDFAYSVHLQADPGLKTGNMLLIEVYQHSPKDGSEIDKVAIPVTFSPLLP